MMQEDKSCPGCHFNHPNYPLKLKLHQEIGWPVLAKNSYIFRKDLNALAKIVDKFNTKFPLNTDQDRVNKPAAKRVSDDSSSDLISAKHVHYPSILNTTIYSTVPPDSIKIQFYWCQTVPPQHAPPMGKTIYIHHTLNTTQCLRKW